MGLRARSGVHQNPGRGATDLPAGWSPPAAARGSSVDTGRRGHGLALQSGHLKASLRRQRGTWWRAVSLGWSLGCSLS